MSVVSQDRTIDLGPDDADIVDPDTYVNGVPHATFRRMRATDPVSWHDETDGGAGFWAVTGYDDVLHVSRQTATFSTAQGIMLEEMDVDDFESRRNMIEYDPPDHTRYRRLVAKPFSRREVWSYENAIRLLTRDVLDVALPAPGSTGSLDFVLDVAKHVPMRTLGKLLGVPDEDGPWLVEQADALFGHADPEFTSHPVGLSDTDDFASAPFRSPAGLDLYRYAEDQAATRRANPTDDVISDLLAPMVDGERLTDAEFKNFFVLLVAAGNDTTRYTMTAGIQALLERPDQLEELRDAIDSGDSDVVDSAVEEILRWATVTMHFRRTATEDTLLRERQIRRGDKVLIFYVSANYDEQAFEDPYSFDIHRSPNAHTAFGLRSPHLCLGAQLARLEIKIMLEELVPRIASATVVGPVERLRSNIICGIKRLPLSVTTR